MIIKNIHVSKSPFLLDFQSHFAPDINQKCLVKFKISKACMAMLSKDLYKMLSQHFNLKFWRKKKPSGVRSIWTEILDPLQKLTAVKD